MRANTIHRGFTMSELAVSLVLLVLVLLLPGLMRERWNASGLDVSMNNVRQILAAASQYRLDNAGRVPMRGSAYTQGMLSSWDTWSSFGKNCSSYWAGQPFDESAYGRALNQYLPSISRIPRPAGFVNTGSGSTWNFHNGTMTAQQRASVEIPACRSPGDVATRQRIWPSALGGISAYDDIGTSYLTNMKWWDQPGISWPINFTQHFNAGTERIRVMRPNDVDRPFAWIHDQTAEAVAYSSNPQFRIKGEFGGLNKSVMGFLTGDADYLTVTANAGSGVGYTFYLRP